MDFTIVAAILVAFLIPLCIFLYKLYRSNKTSHSPSSWENDITESVLVALRMVEMLDKKTMNHEKEIHSLSERMEEKKK